MSGPTHSALTWEVVDDISVVAKMADEWDELLRRSAQSELALAPFWLLTWWDVFGADRELRFGVFRDGRRLVGLAPILTRVHWYKPGIPFRRLELLGTGEEEEHEIASDYVGLMAERGYESEVTSKTVDLVVNGSFGEWDEIVCRRMCAKASTTRAWIRELREHGLHVEMFDEGVSHYIPLPSSWDDYMRALSSSRRYRLRRALRDFEAWSGVEPKLSRVTSEAGLSRGIDLLVDLHSQRWASAGRSGVFASPLFRRFHEQIMPVLLERDALELVWLQGRDGPVAALYNILWDGRMHFYQSGRRMDVPKNLRPGVVIHALAIQRAIAAGHREYDFLAGRARYKAELALGVRPLAGFRVTRSSLKESTRSLLTKGARLVRSLTSKD